MEELHLTKKDFRVEWYSGTGGGGQHRNKHQNCCRIIHKDTGLRAQGSSYRERPANQKEAFTKLARLIIAYYSASEQSRKEFVGEERIRTYHEPRNEVLDEASRTTGTYKDVVVKGNIGPMIEARRAAKGVLSD
jgi:protein subunit release factor A